MSEVWTRWESQVINGMFPLRRFLGASDHSAVFLTEHKSRGLADAAIKLVPAHPAHSDGQLARWKTAASLSHEHLLRVFDSGRCQLGGTPYLYLLMEYAEENLGQILPQRALTAEETRGLLEPTLHGLAYLHGRGLVQGQIKPPNILVIGDQVKLATDTIRPVGQSAPPANMKWTPYDPPEARAGTVSSASDVWGLGVMLVETLTQSLPVWPEGSDNVSLPLTLPSKFVDMVRRCLSRTPSSRPTVSGLEARIRLRPLDDVVDVPASPAPAAAGASDAVSRTQPAAPPASTAAAAAAANTTPSTATQASVNTAPSTVTQASASTPPSTTPKASASTAGATTPKPPASTAVPSPSGSPATRPAAQPASDRNPAKNKAESSGKKNAAGSAAGRVTGSAAGNVAGGAAGNVAGGAAEGSTGSGPGARAAGASDVTIPTASSLRPSGSKSTANSPVAPEKPMAARAAPTSAGKEPAGQLASDAPAPKPSYVPQIVAVLVVFAIVWGGLRFFGKSHSAAQQPVAAAQTVAPDSTAASSPSGTDGGTSSPAAAAPTSQVPAASSGTEHARATEQSGATDAGSGVLHQELPEISSSARNTIRGHIRISVRVTTDRAGTVTSDVLETAGPSKYFARQVAAAARKWKFAPIEGRDSQQWMLWFELTREGATARATREP